MSQDQQDNRNKFLIRNKEKADFNQYWYSQASIEAMVSVVENECKAEGGFIAFLSTPSIYFSIKDESIRSISKVFDIDTKWKKDPGFVYYDFKNPTQVPQELVQACQCVVIDPPFITEEVWKLYAETARLLLKPNEGKVLLTTIAENAPLIKELLGAEPQVWQPSIPQLVYQYNAYSNFSSPILSKRNEEIPLCD